MILAGNTSLNQLTAFARGTLSGSNDTITTPSHSQGWSMDALGNFTSVTTDGTPQSRTHNLQNEVTAVGGSTLTFDANGNTTTDDNGKTLVYDAWNRLVAYKNGSTTLVSYQYDGLGRRIVENPGTARDLYYSAGWQVLEERVGGVAKVQYVWSPVYVDALVLRDRDSTGGGTLNERLWVQQDANWNVTALVDGTGAVQERYAYDPYGKVTVLSAAWAVLGGSAYAWVYVYQGGRLDTTTGLYGFRNRDLSPTLMRWVEVDPLGFGAGDTNFYRDVGNNVMNKTDPTGLAGKTVILGGGTATAYVEWFPDKGVGEMKVMRGDQELVRYRWARGAERIETILEHGGKKLPGVSQSLMKEISLNVTDQMRVMVEKAGGESAWSRNLVPSEVKAGYPPGKVGGGRPLRSGRISSQLLAELGAGIIVAGSTYVYDDYVDRGWEIGIDLLDKIELGTKIRYMGELGELPGPVFDIVGKDGKKINVVLQQDGYYHNKWYVTASYGKKHWNPIAGTYYEPVYLVTKDHNYTVYDPKWTRPVADK